MSWRQAFQPLRHRDYAKVWFSAFVSNIGTWIETVAVAAYVTEATGKAAWTGLVAAAAFLPVGVIGPIGGALADRVPRKLLLIGANGANALIAATLTILFAAGDPAPGLVVGLVLLGGCCSAIGFPAYQTILPDLVPPEDLPGALGLASAQWNLGRVIGPIAAGVAIAIGGYATAEAANALSFAAPILVVATLRLPPPHPHDGQGLLRSIRTGFSFALAEPGLRPMLATMLANTLLVAPFIALVPAMAMKVHGTSESMVSVFVTSQGFGAVVMGFAIAVLAHRWAHRVLITTFVATTPIALIAYAVAPNIALASAALAVVGFLYLGALSSFMTVTQLRAPAQLRGRVMSVLNLILGLAYPLGALVQGRIADEVGLRETTAAAAVGMLVLFAGTALLRPRLLHPLDEPVDSPSPTPAPMISS